MSYTIQEKIGIIDLLQTERNNISILYQLAKSVTKNVVNVNSELEALDTIFLHIPDCTTLLSKRLITKEILFRYLHKKKVPLTTDFTKSQLVKKVVDYWYQNYASMNTPNGTTTVVKSETDKQQNHSQLNHNSTQSTSTTTNATILQEPSEFPIHLLARKFSEWFFDNYNKNLLKVNDFWTDASLLMQIAANDGIDEHLCQDSESILQNLLETRQRFGFYFNPNLTHAGVQGRMDVHGLVLVLSCGTLHTSQDCVGVFECVFGLLRDPFAENNWKTKNIKLILRSKGAAIMPSLEESDDMKEALELPVPQGELS
ncbi:uncharacterized protein C3orf38 homolog [Lucilia cuprina]|uniref:uncharacterized protein C3orf38 homolog n=1 Tax=Lucilia cuprina TaxID=7375 RepID=UPI001F05A6A9|nr:uncharacterized protein C3orf38 homolog [Lucilia cuprina]